MAASSSPKKPARFNCARFGSIFGGAVPASNAGFVVGKNKFIAVDATISSSKPSNSVILRSTHCDITGMLIFCKFTSVEKLDGNVVVLSNFFIAWSSSTLIVPLIVGILNIYLFNDLVVQLNWQEDATAPSSTGERHFVSWWQPTVGEGRA